MLAEDEAESVAGLTCLQESAAEGSGGNGSGTKVYLRGDDIQYLDTKSELGNKIIRREYRFKHRTLILVVETIHNKGDRHTGIFKHPRLVSTKKFEIEDPECERRGEFLQQARQLLGDFRAHREAFQPCEKARE